MTSSGLAVAGLATWSDKTAAIGEVAQALGFDLPTRSTPDINQYHSRQTARPGSAVAFP